MPRYPPRSPVPLEDMSSLVDQDYLVDDEPKTKWYTFTNTRYDQANVTQRGASPRPFESLPPRPRRWTSGKSSLGATTTSGASVDALGKRSTRGLSPTGESLASQLHTTRTRADSEHYFGEQSVHPGINDGDIDGTSTPHNVEVRGYNIKQSQRLPYWIWFAVAKSLGIKLYPRDRPWFGTLLFVLTMLFALVNVFSTSWYLAYDIVNEKTRQTVLTGSTLGLLTVYWCSMCIYANKLAYRLLTNRNMLMSVRMHSKTMFKINTVFLLSLLGLAFMILNNYKSFPEFYDSACSTVYLPSVICKLRYLSRVGVAVFGLIWNLLVGNVVLSVCRTHTIGIRRFIRELETDGLTYVQYCRDLQNGYGRFDDVMHNFETAELPYEEELAENVMSESWAVSSRRLSRLSRHSQGWKQPFSTSRHNSSTSAGRGPRLARSSSHGGEGRNEPSPPVTADVREPETESVQEAQELETILSPSVVVVDADGEKSGSETPKPETHHEVDPPQHQHDDDVAGEHADVELPNLFTTEDILLSYHQIMVRLRTTSRNLQRWMASWIALITLWSILYVIYWINHAATFTGIAEFVIPLLILPLICSAYAEVNFEGRRLLKCICPLEDRVPMLIWMNNAPLQMTVYDTPISFSSIVTVIAAVGLAFLTRIMLSELDIG